MKETKDVIACVVEDGQFFDLAVRLSREYSKVYWHNPTLLEGFPTVNRAAIGQGFEPEVEWVEDLWSVKNDVDLFIFPDVGNSGIQLELESQGKRVIGSRTADTLELKRISFKRVQKELGLNVPIHTVIRGLDELRDFLSDVQDVWVKISKYRGTFETQHHQDYELSCSWLDRLACELGPLADDYPFLVEQPIQADVEFGYDGFCFDGEFPELTLFGPEIKSKAYIGSVVNYDDLDPRLRSVNEMLSPELYRHRYRNFFSTEVRITNGDPNFKDDEPILIEPTCRIPSPPFEAELEVYANLGEMLWHGSVGEVVKPDMAADCVALCRFSHKDEASDWRYLRVKPQDRRWIKLYDAYRISEDLYGFPPKAPYANRIGAVVGLGDTIEEAIDQCREHLDVLDEQPVDDEFSSLSEAVSQIQKAEKAGIQFTDEPVPAPEDVHA